MEINRQFNEEDTFQNPDVEEEIVMGVIEYLSENKKSYPWDIIVNVSESYDVPKKTVREAIRSLREGDKIAPAPPFVGELQLTMEK